MRKPSPSAELAVIVGSSPLTRSEVSKYVWIYIKKHKLQDTEKVLMINADASMQKIFS